MWIVYYLYFILFILFSLLIIELMYLGCRDIWEYDNVKWEWFDDDLKKFYDIYEKFLDFVLFYCFVFCLKYLLFGFIR